MIDPDSGVTLGSFQALLFSKETTALNAGRPHRADVGMCTDVQITRQICSPLAAGQEQAEFYRLILRFNAAESGSAWPSTPYDADDADSMAAMADRQVLA